MYYRETWIEGRGRNSAALHTTDRAEAQRRAEAFYSALVSGHFEPSEELLTLEELWRRYQEDSPAYRMLSARTKADRIAAAKRLIAGFGPKKVVEHLTLTDVDHYVEIRRRGTGWRDGRITRRARNRTIASDLQVLRTMLLWATRSRNPDGSWLLRDYPLRGLRLPREENARRPVATFERYLKLRQAAQELASLARREDRRVQWVRLELALVLAEATGARIGAIAGLRWSDIESSPPRIHWRAEFDKRGRDRTVPITPELLRELRGFQAKLGGGIGEGWLFPSKDGSRPWPRELFGQKLIAAEQHAGLEHLRGGLWHPLRRKWATERKDLPLVDVMAAGGWRDSKTLLTSYQHADEASLLRVMAEPRKLMSVGLS